MIPSLVVTEATDRIAEHLATTLASCRAKLEDGDS